MKRLRILLGDDHSLVVEGIRGLLADGYEVVGSADNGQSLVDAARQLTPDLVILDISMPVLNGIDAGRAIKKANPETKLVFLTMHTNAVYLRKAMEAGASAYVLKSGASAELLSAIDAVCRKNIYVSPGFGQKVLETLADVPEKASRSVIELTSRQRQILQMIAEGKQNKDIAEVLQVSVKTVEFHRARLMTKLGARTVAELTRVAIEEGLIGIRDSLL
jgi:DNA-binding NarL/FixJ family response regulator